MKNFPVVDAQLNTIGKISLFQDPPEPEEPTAGAFWVYNDRVPVQMMIAPIPIAKPDQPRKVPPANKCPPDEGWGSRKIHRFQHWICNHFGHSFSFVDALKFKIKNEGRCFTVDSYGLSRQWTGRPEIRCRRCKKVLTMEGFNNG